MKKTSLLNVTYAAVLSLGLMAATVQASEMSVIYADDDIDIVNVGVQLDEKSSATIESLSIYVDDDVSIAQLGNDLGHDAHSVEIDVEIYADDDLAIVQLGNAKAHCKV